MKNIFEPRAEHLGCIPQFSAPLVSTVFHGTESISFLWPKIQSLLPENFKNIDSLQNFKISIKMWKPENCPCRLCKVSIKNVGFLQNKKPCIVSQYDILIIKFKIFRFRSFTFLVYQKFNLSPALQWQESYVFKQYYYSCGFVQHIWPSVTIRLYRLTFNFKDLFSF